MPVQPSKLVGKRPIRMELSVDPTSFVIGKKESLFNDHTALTWCPATTLEFGAQFFELRLEAGSAIEDPEGRKLTDQSKHNHKVRLKVDQKKVLRNSFCCFVFESSPSMSKHHFEHKRYQHSNPREVWCSVHSAWSHTEIHFGNVLGDVGSWHELTTDVGWWMRAKSHGVVHHVAAAPLAGACHFHSTYFAEVHDLWPVGICLKTSNVEFPAYY